MYIHGRLREDLSFSTEHATEKCLSGKSNHQPLFAVQLLTICLPSSGFDLGPKWPIAYAPNNTAVTKLIEMVAERLVLAEKCESWALISWFYCLCLLLFVLFLIALVLDFLPQILTFPSHSVWLCHRGGPCGPHVLPVQAGGQGCCGGHSRRHCVHQPFPQAWSTPHETFCKWKNYNY